MKKRYLCKGIKHRRVCVSAERQPFMEQLIYNAK